MGSDNEKSDVHDIKKNYDDTKKEDETNKAFVQNVTWRHYMFFIIHMFQSVGSAIGFPVMSQYFYHKLNKEYFAEHNITFESSTPKQHLGQCFVNKSSQNMYCNKKFKPLMLSGHNGFH